MNCLGRFALRSLTTLGFASAITVAATAPALASPGVTEVRATGCPDDPPLPPWAESVERASQLLELHDPGLRMEVTTTVLLDPNFEGERDFFEPSSFRAMTTHRWDFTPMVAGDDASSTTAGYGQRNAPAHVLAGYGLYGIGEGVYALTIGSFVADMTSLYDDPVAYFVAQPGKLTGVTYLWNAAQAISDAYENPPPVPDPIGAFQALPSHEQARVIGNATGVVLVVLAPASKGTGSKSLDKGVARWNGFWGTAATKPTPKPGTGPLKFSQKTASQWFSEKSRFEGVRIFDVAELLRAGKLTPDDVPVEFLVRDGNRLIVNTRSSLALKQARIPESRWKLIDRTGDVDYERAMTQRLFDNKLEATGTETLRITGANSSSKSVYN